MRRIVGCDVHSTRCTLVSLNATGRNRGHDVVETSQKALVPGSGVIRLRVHHPS